MESDPTGSYISLVMQLETAADGKWYIHVDDAGATRVIPLTPATLVLRLWRVGETGLLRGTIRLRGGDHWAPIQSNTQLEELVRAWLLGGDNQAGRQ